MALTVAVIGAGPAGLIAATMLADDYDVTIYEARRSAGRKFLLAGRGGLNITHSEPLDALLERYGPERLALEQPIRAFDPDRLRAWCASHNEDTFVGTSGRVFPRSLRAAPLLRSWLQRLGSQGAELKVGHTWVGWDAAGDLLFETADDVVAVNVDATVFALGGASWPRVSSDGSWYRAFSDAGIEMKPLAPANCGIEVAWSNVLRERFAGVPIKNAIWTFENVEARGDAIITEKGLEGGPIYAHSRAIRESLDRGDSAELRVDLAPDLSTEALVDRLNRRRAKASVSSWLSSAGLSRPTVALLREVTANAVPDTAIAVAALVKSLPISVAAMSGIGRAISTAGGVRLEEINEDFMLIDRPGVFVAGEMLDWEAPTGGYLLQACFSTGVAAARGVRAWLDAKAG